MKRMLALLAAVGTLAISGTSSADPGTRLPLLDRVTTDPAVTRRHEALARLEPAPVSRSDHSSSFDWGDGAIGFGLGSVLIGLANAARGRVHRMPRAAP